MAIISFTDEPFRVDQFIQLGFGIYRGDRNWIPPIKKDLLRQLTAESDVLQRPESSYRHFLAHHGDDVVGRVSAFVNPRLRDTDGSPVGTVGYFECIEDYTVATELLHAATEWLRSERGLERVWGPMNYDIWHGYRFMVRGFERKAFCSEPYNKPYYPEYFQRFGFLPKQTWVSVDLHGRAMLEAVSSRGEARSRQVLGRGYRFAPFNLDDYEQELYNLYGLLCQSFSGFLGFTATSFAEFKQIFTPNRCAVDPSLFIFARDERGDLAGFAGSFLDVSDGVRSMNGKSDLTAHMRFLFHRYRVNRLIFYLGGITPEEAKKRVGLARAAFYHIIQQAMVRGYEDVVVALMADGNVVRGVLNGFTAQAQRQYALYELQGGSRT